MPCRRDFIRKVLDNTGEIVYGKRYDYISLDKGEYWQVYRRQYEGKQWLKMIKIQKQDYNSNGNCWKYEENAHVKLGTHFVI